MTQSDIARSIRQAEDILEENVRKQDAVALVKPFYTDDAVVMAQDQPGARGLEQIRQLWQGLFDAGLRELKLEMEQLKVSGDLAVEIGRGRLTLRAPGGKPKEAKSKYILV